LPEKADYVKRPDALLIHLSLTILSNNKKIKNAQAEPKTDIGCVKFARRSKKMT